MSERLPSVRALCAMSKYDAYWILRRIADTHRESRQHILSGYYVPGPGHTRRSILETNRRRLARVYARATEFGHDIGQPEQPAG